MTIDMSTTRTDLALESVQAACSGAETGTISGVRSRERTREGYAVTDIRVEDEDGAQALGKPVGRYVTVDLGPYFRREADYFDRGVRCLAGELAALLPEGPVLAAGLGNRAMTCDAVGPASIDNLLVTRHMIRAMPRQFADFRPVAAVCPGVLARTGLEEVWKGVEEYLDHIQKNGYFQHNRNRQNKYWMYESINEALRGSFYRDPAVEACIGAYEKRVLEDKISSFIAAKELLEIYFKDARTLE